MSAFTVQKPSERSAVVTADAAHLTRHKQIIVKLFNINLFIFLVSFSVAGLLDMSLSIWSHCLRRNSNKVSQSSSTNSQVGVRDKLDLLTCSIFCTGDSCDSRLIIFFSLSKEMFEARMFRWAKKKQKSFRKSCIFMSFDVNHNRVFQEILPSCQKESYALAGLTIPGHMVLTLTLQQAGHCKT